MRARARASKNKHKHKHKHDKFNYSNAREGGKERSALADTHSSGSKILRFARPTAVVGVARGSFCKQHGDRKDTARRKQWASAKGSHTRAQQHNSTRCLSSCRSHLLSLVSALTMIELVVACARTQKPFPPEFTTLSSKFKFVARKPRLIIVVVIIISRAPAERSSPLASCAPTSN